jgi:hypothetical protein
MSVKAMWLICKPSFILAILLISKKVSFNFITSNGLAA